MIDFKFKTKMPDIKFNPPDSPVFWKAVALEAQKDIRVRTETKKDDVEDKPFKPYDKAYREYRLDKGRSGRPNLSFTGRMLGGMVAIGRKGMAIVRLTGEQGFKAIQNEDRGREFFGLNKSQTEGIFKGVSNWIAKKNNLK